jgi:hypothetical protein
MYETKRVANFYIQTRLSVDSEEWNDVIDLKKSVTQSVRRFFETEEQAEAMIRSLNISKDLVRIVPYED